MLRSAVATLGLTFASCTLGDVGGGTPTGDDDVSPQHALCDAVLELSGTLSPPGTPPTPELGCVPEGRWTVSLRVGANDCGDVPMAAAYTYVVTGTGRDREIAVEGADGHEVNLNIHAGGNGECEGSFEHIWPAADGFHVALLKPWFPPGSVSIVGTGSYQLWTEHP
jgi:hypothetical protein